MSLFGSLFSSVSGLAAQSRAMAMISANVANVNTTAYKRVGAEFSTLVTRMASAATFSSGGVRPHFSRAPKVYDSLGAAPSLALAFLKSDAAPHTGSVEIYAAPDDVDAASHPDGLLASGTVSFNGDGDGTLAASALTPVDPDGAAGAEVGELNGVSIDDVGYVIASLTKGEQRKLYKRPLATFASPGALDPRTGNVYAQTAASGRFNLRHASRPAPPVCWRPPRWRRPTSTWPMNSPK